MWCVLGNYKRLCQMDIFDWNIFMWSCNQEPKVTHIRHFVLFKDSTYALQSIDIGNPFAPSSQEEIMRSLTNPPWSVTTTHLGSIGWVWIAHDRWPASGPRFAAVVLGAKSVTQPTDKSSLFNRFFLALIDQVLCCERLWNFIRRLMRARLDI